MCFKIDNNDNNTNFNAYEIGRKWGKLTDDAIQVRASKKKKTTMLQFVIFDALMWQGDDKIMKLPYAERLELLQKNVRSKSAVVIVIPDGDRRVRTAKELEEILKKTVEDGHEGCMLKDPMASYKCKRVRCMQKVKPRGPDINVCVVGLGFSISNNPRRWGILTALRWTSSVEKQIMTYCRTEVIEGDRLHLAFQHIHRDLDSRLPVFALQQQPLMQRRAVKCRDETHYTAFVTKLVKGELKVEWNDRRGTTSCTLIVLTEALVDVQWLVNPYEVSFSLSLRGDLRPVERSLISTVNYYFGAANEEEEVNNNDGVGVPRHPVARLEFDPREQDWDCIKSTNQKFTEGQNVATCIETWTLRKLVGLRALPPNRQRMEELGRILSAWMGNLDEVWPQKPPGSISSIETLSVALDKAMAHKILHLAAEQKLVRVALRPLSLDERKAMTGLPSRSQWKYHTPTNNNGLIMRMEDEAYDEADTMGEDHQARALWLKQHIVKAIPIRKTSANLGDSTTDSITTMRRMANRYPHDHGPIYNYYGSIDEAGDAELSSDHDSTHADNNNDGDYDENNDGYHNIHNGLTTASIMKNTEFDSVPLLRGIKTFQNNDDDEEEEYNEDEG